MALSLRRQYPTGRSSLDDIGASVTLVELSATPGVRLARNRTEHRLTEKPSKRDVEWSDNNLREPDVHHRMSSQGHGIPLEYPHRLIDNSHLSPGAVAEHIATTIGILKQ